MRARGAMPLILPNTAAGPVTGTPRLPPAVDAVCVPWPPKSRGETNSHGSCSRMPASPPKPALYQRAPISFWLQWVAVNWSPGMQRPCQPGSCW